MRSLSTLLFALSLTIFARNASGQAPKRVDYILRIDSADLTGVAVEMRVQNAPAEFRVSMVAHTEYDDRYWRYVTDLRGESSRGPVSVTREDSAVWRIQGPAGDVTLRYRVRFPTSPPLQQASWMAHLTPVGGLVGGPHSFLYVIGGERSPVRVSVDLPAGWRIVTGLRPVADAGRRTFAATGAEELVDSPMLVGLVRSWWFNVGRVPHEIAFLGRPGGAPFDTALFVSNVERIASATVRVFGSIPYSDYHFLFEDGAFGGLEHVNSVSIGAQSSTLSENPNALLGQIAHEFFHTWNEVRLRPVSWIGIRNVAPEPTGELWWSEGVTLYFADLVLRRAGLRTADSTRVARLERLIGNYLANPSHAMVSPEETSRAFNKPLSVTGDYTPSIFSQGEMLGTVLDLMILGGSNGRHSLADAMRTLSSRFAIDRGFGRADIERAVAEACECNVRDFFDRAVRNPAPLDFNRWLGVIGLRMNVTSTRALSPDGSAAPDIRVWTYGDEDSDVLLRIWFPETAWGRAGFHTGDRVESLDGVQIRDRAQFQSKMRQLKIGDSLRVAVRRGSSLIEKTIIVEGYGRPRVEITRAPNATPAQRRLFDQWMKGA